MTRIEVVCCYVSHNPTVLSPLSRLWCDNQKLVYFLVNSSHLYVLSRKFISRITLTFRFNLTSHAESIVLCGVSHLVINIIWGNTSVWCFISRITLVVVFNLLCHTLSFVASLFKFWRLGSALVITLDRRMRNNCWFSHWWVNEIYDDFIYNMKSYKKWIHIIRVDNTNSPRWRNWQEITWIHSLFETI